MSRSEKSEQNDALMLLSALDRSLFYRQNTGQAWQGTPVDKATGDYIRIEPGMRILRNARPIRFGLEGSGDIMGAYDGRPVAVEMKSATGRQREMQRYFEQAWTKAGGIYVLARTAEEARDGVLLA